MEDNGEKTIHQWLQHLDAKMDAVAARLQEALLSKAAGVDIIRLDDKIYLLENKTHNLELKLVGIATGVSVIGFIIKYFISGV